MDENPKKLLPGEIPDTAEKVRYVCFLCAGTFDIFSVNFDTWCVCHRCKFAAVRKACEEKIVLSSTGLARNLRMGDEFDEGGFWWKVTSLLPAGSHSKHARLYDTVGEGEVLVGATIVEASDNTNPDEAGRVEVFKDDECFEEYRLDFLMKVRSS